MENKKTRIIGIDFGTSSTVVKVHNVGSENRVVSLHVNGYPLVPTIAFRQKENGEMYFGYDALQQINQRQEGTSYKNFKMNLISEDENEREEAESLIKGFLRYIYVQYQNLSNKEGAFDPADEVKVYVSHPAKWNSYARNLMKQCVAEAGFCSESNICLKDEPTAAMLAMLHEKRQDLEKAGLLLDNKKYKAMMIDMGAGTSDIVLCSYLISNGRLSIDDVFTYPSINNEGLCGGREIDEAFSNKVKDFICSMQNRPSKMRENAITNFNNDVKKWKETVVSKTLGSFKNIPEPKAIGDFRDMLIEFGAPFDNSEARFIIDRNIFESSTKDHWIQWANLLNGAFTEVQNSQFKNLECPKSPEDVELLLITGGHSQWYIVKEYILGIGNKPIPEMPDINFAKIRDNNIRLVQSQNPQETVAVGLCHLDEDIVGVLAMANDVSIRFTCEDKFLGSCDLIKKGTPLPFERTGIEIENFINGNFINRRELKIEYCIVTGNSNMVTKSQTVPSDTIIWNIVKLILVTLDVAIFIIPKILWYAVRGRLSELDPTLLDYIVNNKYAIKLQPSIKVNNEGIIEVSGQMIIDGEKLDIPPIML